MNRLQLCREVHRLGWSDSAEPGTVPATTLAQTGSNGRLVAQVDAAWRIIQEESDRLGWRTTEETRTVSAGQTDIPLVTGAVEWVTYGNGPHDAWSLWRPNSEPDATKYRQVMWGFARDYEGQVTPPAAQPSAIYRKRSGVIAFSAPLLESGTFKSYSRKAVYLLTADAEEPILPLEYHWMIVYKAALLTSAKGGGDASQRDDWQQSYERMKSKMHASFDLFPDQPRTTYVAF